MIFSGQGSDELNGGYSTQFGGHGTDGWQQFLIALAYFSANTTTLNSKIIAAWWNRDCPQAPIIHQKLIQDKIFSNYGPADKTPWIAYVKNKIRDLQMYNLWHEDRLAGAVGVENRVPFLNDLVTSALLHVPDIHRESLFWDKAILRNSFLKSIGIKFTTREKVPLFYGKGEHTTAEMMLRIVSKDNFNLVDYAFPANESSYWLNKDNLILFAKRVAEDPQHKGWEKLIRIINIGLLTKMNKHFN